jgi:hypothetical protein
MKKEWILDPNVALIDWLDWNRDLFASSPIDVICEYYGVNKYDRLKVMAYINKGIIIENHIQTIDNYFTDMWMPIPGGFKSYKLNYEHTEPTGEWSSEIQGGEDKGDDSDGLTGVPKRRVPKAYK